MSNAELSKYSCRRRLSCLDATVCQHRGILFTCTATNHC